MCSVWRPQSQVSRVAKDEMFKPRTREQRSGKGGPLCDFGEESMVLSFFKKFIYLFIYLFIYFWLSWVFVAARGLSLVAASGGYSLLRCSVFSLRWLLLMWSMGSRCVGFSSCGTRALEFRLSSCGTQA